MKLRAPNETRTVSVELTKAQVTHYMSYHWDKRDHASLMALRVADPEVAKLWRNEANYHMNTYNRLKKAYKEFDT